MDTLLQDIRYALRKLARTPGFTAAAVGTLALAIGATTAIFTVVDGVLLRPMPFSEPDRVVRLSETARDGRPFPWSVPNFLDVTREAKSFVATAGMESPNMSLTGPGMQPTRLAAARVGDRFFDVLGVRPQLGRTFVRGEDSLSAQRVVVLSDSLWRARFAGDRAIVGRTISLDGNPFVVVGVAPAGLHYPDRPDVWVPMRWEAWEADPSSRGAHSFFAIARLAPGVTMEAADAEVRALGQRLALQYPQSNTGFAATVENLRDQLVGDLRMPLFAMLGAVAFVLLIACANVANLLLVRASSRQGEIAVRTALGAGRGRIVRQLVTESVLLAIVAGIVGAALAAWAVDAVKTLGPADLPRLDEVTLDGRILAFTALIAALTGVLFGLVPAMYTARANVAGMLRESVRGSTRGGTYRARTALVMIEMALAVVLLVGAGLLIRSFARLTSVNPGFRPEQTVVFDLSLPTIKYEYDRTVLGLTTPLTERLAHLPGTQSVGLLFGRPMGHMRARTSFDVVGRPPAGPDDRTVVEVHPATAGIFSALGIPLVQGRFYTDQDDRPGAVPVLVVNQEFVRRYFPTENPIGKRITLGLSHDSAGPNTGVTAQGEIVGVVGDVRQSGQGAEPYPTTYFPYHAWPVQDFTVVVRTTSAPTTVQAAARSIVHDLDPELPIFGLQTMTQVMSESVARPRFYMLLLVAFAAVALVLAAIGIYGVIAYTVSQRTRELGIRLALGASQDRVVSLVLGQGVWLTGTGIVAGIVAAVWLTRVLQTLLFEVKPLDPLTFGGVAFVLLAVAGIASYIPARRAARVDPVVTMRAE